MLTDSGLGTGEAVVTSGEKLPLRIIVVSKVVGRFASSLHLACAGFARRIGDIRQGRYEFLITGTTDIKRLE